MSFDAEVDVVESLALLLRVEVTPAETAETPVSGEKVSSGMCQEQTSKIASTNRPSVKRSTCVGRK